jgi:hypothetical protein
MNLQHAPVAMHLAQGYDVAPITDRSPWTQPGAVWASHEMFTIHKKVVPTEIFSCKAPLLQEPPLMRSWVHGQVTPGVHWSQLTAEGKRGAWAFCQALNGINAALTEFKHAFCAPEAANLDKALQLRWPAGADGQGAPTGQGADSAGRAPGAGAPDAFHGLLLSGSLRAVGVGGAGGGEGDGEGTGGDSVTACQKILDAHAPQAEAEGGGGGILQAAAAAAAPPKRPAGLVGPAAEQWRLHLCDMLLPALGFKRVQVTRAVVARGGGGGGAAVAAAATLAAPAVPAGGQAGGGAGVRSGGVREEAVLQFKFKSTRGGAGGGGGGAGAGAAEGAGAGATVKQLSLSLKEMARRLQKETARRERAEAAAAQLQTRLAAAAAVAGSGGGRRGPGSRGGAGRGAEHVLGLAVAYPPLGLLAGLAVYGAWRGCLRRKRKAAGRMPLR